MVEFGAFGTSRNEQL